MTSDEPIQNLAWRSPAEVADIYEAHLREVRAENERLRATKEAAEAVLRSSKERMAEVERLRTAIVEWGRAESLPDCPACAVFDATLRGGDDDRT